MAIVVKPSNFKVPPNFRWDTYDKIRLAVATVCSELGFEANLSLMTMWMICCDEKDREAIISLVNDELANSL